MRIGTHLFHSTQPCTQQTQRQATDISHTILAEANLESPPVNMAPPPTNEQLIEEAKKVSKTEPAEAEKLYKEVLAKPPGSNEAASKDYENALLGLGDLYRMHKKQKELTDLISTSRQQLSSFAKAKTAKLGMSVIFLFEMTSNTLSTATARPLCRHPEFPRKPNHHY